MSQNAASKQPLRFPNSIFVITREGLDYFHTNQQLPTSGSICTQESCDFLNLGIFFVRSCKTLLLVMIFRVVQAQLTTYLWVGLHSSRPEGIVFSFWKHLQLGCLQMWVLHCNSKRPKRTEIPVTSVFHQYWN